MLILDANNWLWRSHWGSAELEADGQLTGAIHTGLNSLARLPSLFPRQGLVLAWDGANVWRKEVMPEYKANRRRTAEEQSLADAIYAEADILRDILCQIGVTQVRADTLEADDWAGILTERAKLREGCDVTLLSSDKDWFQLLGPGVKQVKAWTGGEFDIWDAERVEREHGVAPERWAEFLALTGDSVDNIPKVRRGLGPKRGAAMLAKGLDLTEEETLQYGLNLRVTGVLRELPESMDWRAYTIRSDDPAEERWERFSVLLETYQLYALYAVRSDLWALGGWR